MKEYFRNKSLLITGGTGSFGNAVVQRFLSSNINEIRIFSRDEKKQDDMRKKFNNEKLKFFIGDVRSRDSLIDPMKDVDFVFHAAALKQVPSCEFYPMQAVETNILGAENVMNVAIDAKVKKLIVLSTDKAVYPINAMGMSKALMERAAIAKSRQINNDTIIACTRYGNVMASRGSVIPLFIEQIKSKKPLTITDPNMTRFMMNLDEAIELVLFAFSNAKQGDIFVQKSPAATVALLAKTINKLFDRNEDDIKIIGTRHGEKLYETLLTREEMVNAIDMDNYFRIVADNRDLNYNKYYSDGEKIITESSEYNSHNTHQLNFNELKKLLLQLKEISFELNQLK